MREQNGSAEGGGGSASGEAAAGDAAKGAEAEKEEEMVRESLFYGTLIWEISYLMALVATQTAVIASGS